jgi:hypothetical protein
MQKEWKKERHIRVLNGSHKSSAMFIRKLTPPPPPNSEIPHLANKKIDEIR